MYKIITSFFVLFFFINYGQNKNRILKKIIKNKENLEIQVSDGTYFLSFVNNDIVETTFVPLNEKFSAVSHAKVAENVLFNYKNVLEKNNLIEVKGKNIEINITKSPFKIAYFHQNKEILSEKLGYLKRKHIPLENVKGNIVYDSTEVLQFNISRDEFLYGGGARALGMNRRGHKLALYNRAHYGYETKSELMNFCIPLVLSSNMYAVHFDNPAIGYLDLDSKKENTLEYETISGRKTYQVIVGKSWENLIENYVELTGKQPLPPIWAFGNFSSRFGYHTQEEVENTIKKFQDEKTPVDAIILDLYWFGKTIKGTMGNLDWDKDNFPNPDKMIADLKAKGVKTILITEPFILTTSSKWQETAAKNVLATLKDGKPATWDFYFGNTGIVDVFKPEGKSWFWDIYKKMINEGVAGLWGDLGEPEVFPSFANTYGGTADEVHNIYGHNWAKLIAEGYQKDFPNKRPFILMRSGYSGSQRFGMIPWSGDVSRSWGGLQSQTEIALQMGMQGMGYMHSDLGGFAGDYYDNELYLRWLQFGVFNPIFRPHAQEEVASEVVYKDIDTKKIAKQAVELRYQLLPYNYNLAFENSRSGKPLMRPLFFEEPQNINLLSNSNGFFWGNDFLIYPITERSQTKKEVYFPKSANWFDFYSGKKYSAGTSEMIELNKNYIPTFVRSGSFIPLSKVFQNTGAYNHKSLDFIYFYEKIDTTENNIYFDSGVDTNDFNNSNYEFLNIKTINTTKSLKIFFEHKSPNKELLKKNFAGTMTLYNIQSKPKKIVQENKEITFEYNEEKKSLQFNYIQSHQSIEIIKEKEF